MKIKTEFTVYKIEYSPDLHFFKKIKKFTFSEISLDSCFSLNYYHFKSFSRSRVKVLIRDQNSYSGNTNMTIRSSHVEQYTNAKSE